MTQSASLRRFLLFVVAIAALVPAAVVALPEPAGAAVGCTWSACNGKDPDAMGCGDDAVTLYSFWATHDPILVELRYSAACHAAWSRAWAGIFGYPQYKYLKLQVWTASSGGSLITSYVKYMPDVGPDVYKWTAMRSFSNWVQACLKNASDFGDCGARR